MAGDLARCFESNASRAQSGFEEIYRKYDREFPNDDILDLRYNRIIHDRGVVKSLQTKRVGCAVFGKHGLHKADSPLYLSQVDSGHSDSSPPKSEKSFFSTSEKSFISVNCSRWVTNIEEESEPSDAETLSSDSEADDSDSWEDETEEATQLSGEGESEEVDSRAGGADWDVPEHGAEEEGGWLTIGNGERWRRPIQRYGNRKMKHDHPHTRYYIAHKRSELDRLLGRRSTDFTKHGQHITYQHVLQNRMKRDHSSKGTPQTGVVVDHNIAGRIGLPRRVKPVQLFSQRQSNEESSGFSKQPRSQTSSATCKENSPLKKMHFGSNSGGDSLMSTGSEPTSEVQPFSSSIVDDVDFFLVSDSETEVIHIDSSPDNSITRSHENNCDGTKAVHSRNEKCPTESRVIHFPLLSRCAWEKTYTISKNHPDTHNRDQLPNGTDAMSFSLKDGKLNEVNLKEEGDTQEVNKEDLKKSGAETLRTSSPIERTHPLTKVAKTSNSSHSPKEEQNLEAAYSSCHLSKVSQCASLKVDVDMPHTLPDTPQKQSFLPHSTVLDTKTGEDVDLKQTEKSLIEIKRKLDRLSALLSPSSNDLTPENSSKQEKQSYGDKVIEPDVALMYSARSEKMEVSPAHKLPGGLSSSAYLQAIHSMENVSKKPSRETRLEPFSPVSNIPVNRTFIVSDKGENEITQHEDPFSLCDPVSTSVSTSGLAVHENVSVSRKQENKIKRKFFPQYKPFSTEEIQEVLETHNTETFAIYLKEKLIKDEPDLPKENNCLTFSSFKNEDGKIYHSFPQQSSETKSLSSSALYPLDQAPSKPEESRPVECRHVPKEDFKAQRIADRSTDPTDECSLVKMCSPQQGESKKSFPCVDLKIFDWSQRAEHQQVEGSQSAQPFLQKPSKQNTVFQATPGLTLRETIRSLCVPSRPAGTDLSISEHLDEKITVVKHGNEDRYNQNSQKKVRENVTSESCQKAGFHSISRGQTATSARLVSEHRSVPVYPAVMTSSPRSEEKQTQSPSTATICSPLLQMKQSADSEPHPKPVHGFFCSTGEKKVCSLKHGFASDHLCKTSSPTVFEADFLSNAQSPVASGQYYQRRRHDDVRASGDNPLSLLNKLDSISFASKNCLSKISSETNQNTEQSQRVSSWCKVTTAHQCVCNTQSGKKHLTPTSTVQPNQEANEDSGRASAGVRCPHRNCSAEYQTVNELYDRGTTSSCQFGTNCASTRLLDHTDQYRTLKTDDKSDVSVPSFSCDSLSITPQTQSHDSNQSTPSKLLNRLHLSSPQSPSNLTKSCDKLSRLRLGSPRGRNGDSNVLVPRTHDRQLGEESNIQLKSASVATTDPVPRNENQSWKIFKSKTNRPVPHTAAECSMSPSSSNKYSQKKMTDSAGISRPKNHSERRMIRISSPQASRLASNCDPFSFTSDSPASSSSGKRSFELDPDAERCVTNKEVSNTYSPLKRRRLDEIIGTSTPSKSNRGAAKFDMDESLSTIAGDPDNLNSTVHSSDVHAPDDLDCGSEEEDEITLIAV